MEGVVHGLAWWRTVAFGVPRLVLLKVSRLQSTGHTTKSFMLAGSSIREKHRTRLPKEPMHGFPLGTSLNRSGGCSDYAQFVNFDFLR
jgi:hypothetical protein